MPQNQQYEYELHMQIIKSWPLKRGSAAHSRCALLMLTPNSFYYVYRINYSKRGSVVTDDGSIWLITQELGSYIIITFSFVSSVTICHNECLILDSALQN